MELNIGEFTDCKFDNFDTVIQSSFEQIPENNVPIKVIKKGVQFKEDLQKPIHQSIPKINAKIVRQKSPSVKPQISYEDILSKMGMLVSDGKLHLMDRNTLSPQKQQKILQRQYNSSQSYEQSNNDKIQYQNQIQIQSQQTNDTNIPKNSYIYNKYFKNEIQPQDNIRRPKTMEEYKQMLLEDFIQKERIKAIKSTKLIMPTSNINISTVNSTNLPMLQNKLFSFSKR